MAVQLLKLSSAIHRSSYSTVQGSSRVHYGLQPMVSRREKRPISGENIRLTRGNEMSYISAFKVLASD